MTTSTHDRFAELAAAYALDALDVAERREFEAHLATCAACQREVADLRRVTAGLGMSADPVAPPESLKARTIARATARPQLRTGASATTPMPPVQSAPRRLSLEWLAAAASITIAVATGIYAWSLRSQLHDLNRTVVELSDRANTLRNNLDEARRETARLSNVVNIVRGPGTIQVSLSGTKDAPGAAGRAYFNAARGMVVSAEQMPALRPGRAYQLWLIVPTSPKPLSAGVFSVAADGSATFIATVPASFEVPAGAAVTVAVTEEPAGGSDGPTSAVLLAGELKAR
jgi:anti-sigma-K factor RskA